MSHPTPPGDGPPEEQQHTPEPDSGSDPGSEETKPLPPTPPGWGTLPPGPGGQQAQPPGWSPAWSPGWSPGQPYGEPPGPPAPPMYPPPPSPPPYGQQGPEQGPQPGPEPGPEQGRPEGPPSPPQYGPPQYGPPQYGQQQYGQQQYGQQQYGSPYGPQYGPGPWQGYVPTGPVTNQKASWALAAGIGGIVLGCCLGILGLVGIVGIVLGVQARKEIAQSGGQQTGQGLALAGIITGSVATVLGVGLSLLTILLLAGPSLG